MGREKSLRVFIPEAKRKHRSSMSLDEEMRELEEDVAPNMIEFLDEDPEEFQFIREAIAKESSEEPGKDIELVTEKTDGHGNDVVEKETSAWKKRAELKTKLAYVDKRLSEIKAGDSGDRERDSSSRPEKKNRDSRRREGSRPSSPPRVVSSVTSVRNRRKEPEREKRRETVGNRKEKGKVYEKRTDSFVAGLAREFTPTPHPLMDIKIENPLFVLETDKETRDTSSSERKKVDPNATPSD